MPAVDSHIYIYYAHFIKDFTLTLTKSDGSTTGIYTKADATLEEDGDCYIIFHINSGYETFTIEGEGFVRREGELGYNANIDMYLQPSNLYAYEIDGHPGNYGYLASLPPVVNKSLLYDSNGTFENPAILGNTSAYIYEERITEVSGDKITVNAYVEAGLEDK